jgi:hypothetical protein
MFYSYNAEEYVTEFEGLEIRPDHSSQETKVSLLSKIRSLFHTPVILNGSRTVDGIVGSNGSLYRVGNAV